MAVEIIDNPNKKFKIKCPNCNCILKFGMEDEKEKILGCSVYYYIYCPNCNYVVLTQLIAPNKKIAFKENWE